MPPQLDHAHTDVGNSCVSELIFRNWFLGKAAMDEAV